MVSVTDLALIAVALAVPVCLLAAVAIIACAIMASARQTVLERTVEMLTRRLVALQARQSVMAVEPTGRSRDAISMGPPLSDEPAPDPNGLVDPAELLRGARDASAGDWEPKLDRRVGGGN